MMIAKYLLIIFFSFSLLAGCAYPHTFTFTTKESQWTFYGDGVAQYSTDVGRGSPVNSLKLAADFGETQTAYYTWKNLEPGNYKVVTFVRAQDVQPGDDGFSFWHFHDGGFGTVSTFTNLYGDYEWRKVEYSIKVKDKDLTVWFRLKSPGVVWVDEFYLEKAENLSEKVIIESPTGLKTLSSDKNNIFISKPLSQKLFNFEVNESGHPFNVANHAGKFSAKDYHNFKINKLSVKDWSAYDRLEMDIFNPHSSQAPFYVTLTDDKTTDYWSQANYKQSLSPGWNHLSLPLAQYVGERGSHRFNRTLNLKQLRKFFIAVDPESKLNFEIKDFLIDNIYLTSNPYPQIPAGVKSFDFTSHKAAELSNFTTVTSQTLYNEKRGYGFVRPQYWRVEDSQYASIVNRYSIGILSGQFKVNLPNGKYQVLLNIEKLGYWDVPFWSDRTILMNGIPVFKESRPKGQDYLADLLRFSTLNPSVSDHPYELYLKKIFTPVEKTVEVKNGVLEIDFHGDASAISLNSLILWNKLQESAGRSYVNALDKKAKQEFTWMSRSINSTLPQVISSESIGVVEPSLTWSPRSTSKIISESLHFSVGVDETSSQIIQFTNAGAEKKVSWKLSELKNEAGVVLAKNQLTFNDVVFQYTSPDTNHETYLVSGKFLKPIVDSQLVLKKNESRYLWLKFTLATPKIKGTFKGEITFTQGSIQKKIPITIVVSPYKTPAVDFPVGFFGLDPLPYSYFKNPDYNGIRKKYRHLALQKIGSAGFTTFTGLPEKVEELNELFALSSKFNIQTVYSYGGQFPQNFLDENKKPNEMTAEAYLRKSSATLKSLLSNKAWPKIVHTFSDEAGGYSDKIAADIETAKKLKTYFPFLPIGGFGFFDGQDSQKLNSYFDYGFYSSLTKADVNKLKNQNQRWGLYNGSAGNFDDPRFSFGLGLYVARMNGLSQYLEWNAASFNNYPYYDFDGRESDIVIFYPTLQGELMNSIRFELSLLGLQTYRKLKLLESVVQSTHGSKSHRDSAAAWLNTIKREYFFYSSSQFINQKDLRFKEISSTLDTHLRNLFP